MVFETLVPSIGVVLILLGLADVFLTILHPDRDGPVTRPMFSAIWRMAVALSRALPKARREILAFAGPTMLATTILTWMALPILGFALLTWPGFATDFNVPNKLAPHDFGDSLYFSAVAFTTLGFGDISPVTPRGEFLAVAEGINGFILGAAAIAFILNVFHGVDRRDGMALRALAESRRTWRGAEMLRFAVETEGMDGLRRRVEGWSIMLRGLHERIYRFQALSFYIRTRGARYEPERMFAALSELTIAANVYSRRPEAKSLRMSAEGLAIMLEEFARTLGRHHGTRAHRERLEHPRPTEADVARLRVIADALPGGAPPGIEHDEQLLRIAAFVGIFHDLAERITRRSWWGDEDSS